jgi:hypothetical protein
VTSSRTRWLPIRIPARSAIAALELGPKMSMGSIGQNGINS